jgi:hypothetical protein
MRFVEGALDDSFSPSATPLSVLVLPPAVYRS